MKNLTQRETNPFKYSDSNKRYHTFDYYMRGLFGEKCAKVSLDAGFTCPNIDGRCSAGGCIYCLNGSGGSAGKTLAQQYEAGRRIMEKKWKCRKFIPYLQAHTNTYAPVEILMKTYDEVASFDGAVMLAIATRADCLPDEVVELLRRTSEKIPIMVELGLQSIHDKSAEIINRGHSFSDFCSGYNRLRAAGGNIKIGIHLIDGLPGESLEDMKESAAAAAEMNPDMIKIHLLHVLRGTPLAGMYGLGKYRPLELTEYVKAVCDQLELIPGRIAIGRVTGDGLADKLIAPLWSVKKTAVSNEIDKELYRRGTFQGCLSRE